MREFDSFLDLCLSEAEVEFKWIVVFISIDSLTVRMLKKEFNTCPGIVSHAMLMKSKELSMAATLPG